jgi:hypothetical protein
MGLHFGVESNKNIVTGLTHSSIPPVKQLFFFDQTELTRHNNDTKDAGSLSKMNYVLGNFNVESAKLKNDIYLASSKRHKH